MTALLDEIQIVLESFALIWTLFWEHQEKQTWSFGLRHIWYLAYFISYCFSSHIFITNIKVPILLARSISLGMFHQGCEGPWNVPKLWFWYGHPPKKSFPRNAHLRLFLKLCLTVSTPCWAFKTTFKGATNLNFRYVEPSVVQTCPRCRQRLSGLVDISDALSTLLMCLGGMLEVVHDAVPRPFGHSWMQKVYPSLVVSRWMSQCNPTWS